MAQNKIETSDMEKALAALKKALADLMKEFYRLQCSLAAADPPVSGPGVGVPVAAPADPPVSGPGVGVPVAAPAEAKCSVCTFLNNGDAVKCEMCGRILEEPVEDFAPWECPDCSYCDNKPVCSKCGTSK